MSCKFAACADATKPGSVAAEDHEPIQAGSASQVAATIVSDSGNFDQRLHQAVHHGDAVIAQPIRMSSCLFTPIGGVCGMVEAI